MMAYMGAAVASELPSSSAYTTLQQQLQRSISTPASTYSSSAMSILQLTESPTAAAAAANSSLASFSDKFLLDSSCQDSPYTPHGSHATVTSACSSYQSDGSAALSGWQALDNMQQQQLANIAAQTSPPPAAVSLQLAVAGSSSCSSSEILGSTMMSSDWQQLLDSSCNRFRISSGIEGFTATTAGGHSNRLGGGNSAVRTAGGRRGGGGTTVGAGHSSCIDSKLLHLSTAPRRPWGSLEKASCGISVEPTKGALALQGVGLATSHCLEQFSSDPAFAERAAKFSSFSNNAGKYGSQIPQPLPFVTSASDHSGGKSRHAPRVGSCSAPSRAAAPQLADSESCKISSRSSCPAAVAAAGAAASGTAKIINLQTACTSSSLSQKLETANDPMQQDTQTETDQPRDTQDPDRQLAPLLVAPTDHHQDSAPVQKPELIIPPLQQQQQLKELETTGIVEAATDSDMIDVKELAAGHAGPTQEADFSSTSEQATCTTRAESSDDTARNKRKKQLHSETVKDQSHTTAAYFTESKLQQQVDDSASDQDSRAKRLKERRHAAAAAALEIHREDTMTMTTTTTTTTTKSATFKDILASERSSSENSGDEPLSPGSTRLAGNKNKKNKQQQGTLHPSTMKNKVKVLQQQPPCSEPTTSCKQDYVHVRARRGQATDSHSLAERVRREKISERMKYLQDLVPGCTKVTGKAVMLDEIINYVQSLQQQVEFLSMKLASVNPPLDYNLDTILNRECPNLQMLQSGASSLLGLEPSSNYWLHQTPLIQQPITTDPEHFSSLGTIDAHHLRRTFSAPTRVPSASSVDAFGDDTTQISTGWDGELQSILQMGFAQTGRATSLLDGFNNCQLAAGHMKVEL